VALCQARISTKPLWGFPQVILIIPSHVPNNMYYPDRIDLGQKNHNTHYKVAQYRPLLYVQFYICVPKKKPGRFCKARLA
jgi:hypothetical protein